MPKGISAGGLRAVRGGLVGCDGKKCFFLDSASQQVELVSLGFKPTSSLASAFTFSVAEGFGSLWVTGGDPKSSAIHRVDPRTFQETAQISLPTAGLVFIAENHVWAYIWRSGLFYRVDPQTNQVTAKIAVDKGFVPFPAQMTVAEGSVWAIDYQDGILRRVDLESGRSLVEIRVGPSYKGWLSEDGYSGMTFGEGAIWITETKANLIKVDPKTDRVVATIPIGRLAQRPAVGGGFVWVSAYHNDVFYVLKIDPRTNQIVGKIFLPSMARGFARFAREEGSLVDLAADEDGIWAWKAWSGAEYIWRISF
jgi:streptogramin lyase